MRRIALEKIVPGSILAKTVFDEDGRVLLNRGVELNEFYFIRLKENGFTELYIEDEISEGIYINDVICEETRVSARVQIKKLMKSYGTVQTAMHMGAMNKTLEKIVDELFHSKDMIVNLTDIKSMDDYTFEHCVNVCVLSIIIGIRMGYNKFRLKELGMGALLHDIGKLRVPEQILKKPSQLTEKEFEEIKKHAGCGYEILKKYNSISVVSACIALTHHERFDGSGYPLGLKGENIHECARIVAVADVYDALTSDRVYRNRLKSHEVIEYITTVAASHFDKNIVEHFVKSIAKYPAGTGVILNTGEKGLVVSTGNQNSSKPVVRVIYDQKGNKLNRYYEIDLSEEGNLCVAETCDF